MSTTQQRLMKIRANTHQLLTAGSLCLVCLSTSQFAHAGAWVPAKGEGYNKYSFTSYEADEFRGEGIDFGAFESDSYTFYGEYGLGNNFAIYGSLAYQELDQADGQGVRTSGSDFSNLELGVRYQWQAEPFVLSTSLLVSVPYLYDEDAELPTGFGQEDIEFRVLVGKSLYPYGYFGVEFGYRYRTDFPSDEYRYLIEYGYDINENVYVRTKLDGILSANNADTDANAPGGNFLLAPELDLGKLELTAGYNFGKPVAGQSRWGIEFTYTNEIYGDNSLLGDSFSLGITRVF